MLDIPESGHFIFADLVRCLTMRRLSLKPINLDFSRQERGFPGNISHLWLKCGSQRCLTIQRFQFGASFADCQAVDLLGPAQYGFPRASVDLCRLTSGDLPVGKPRDAETVSVHKVFQKYLGHPVKDGTSPQEFQNISSLARNRIFHDIP